jgi:SAM-dependent methyltransferase
MMSEAEFLDLFDRFVKWPQRLKREGAFLSGFLEKAGAKSIVDAGAGTGRHAAYLAKLGYEVTAADVAPSMVEEMRRHAEEVGAEVRAVQCSFSEVGEHVGRPQDAVLCLGNSLAMLPDLDSVRDSVGAFASILRPGGVAILHVLNYVGLRAMNKRISRPTPLGDGSLLVKFFDLEPEATRVNFIHLTRSDDGSWRSGHRFAPLNPLSREEMESVLKEKEFTDIEFFGGADGSAYDPAHSYDLFVKAVLAE